MNFRGSCRNPPVALFYGIFTYSTLLVVRTRPKADFARFRELFICRARPIGGEAVIDDTPLIERSLRGDSAAFGQLVQQYQDRLFNTVVHVAASREEAEDVVQETFVQAYLKLASFQGHSAFFTWVYRIAFNLTITRRRRKKNEVSLDAAREQQGLDAIDHAEQAEQQLMREERSGAVHAALGQLAEEARAVLVLREIEGLDYEAIADILDLPLGTVRSRLHRARLQLRDILKARLEDSTSRD